MPVIALGAAFTVTTVEVVQPLAPQIIVAVPAATPVHVPEELIVATAGVDELHVTPGVALVSVADCPEHKDSVPLIAPGLLFTVSTAVARQPVGNV